MPRFYQGDATRPDPRALVNVASIPDTRLVIDAGLSA
jgi:hypothetical protein